MKISFSNIWKQVQYDMMTQAGIPVTPQQLGLKVPAAANGSGFSQYLSGQSMPTLPTPPTPPTDYTDQAAVQKYNQDLLTYNQSFQSYQVRMMQMMNMRFNQLQQSIVQANRNTGGTSRSSSASNQPSGVGGILDSVSDISSI